VADTSWATLPQHRTSVVASGAHSEPCEVVLEEPPVEHAATSAVKHASAKTAPDWTITRV
jgi:hypothetical protein